MRRSGATCPIAWGGGPILLLSTFGAIVSYAVFAVGSGLENHTLALWVLLLSRVAAGICGGNITVAQAYVADLTPPDQRSAKMGLIGMAIGLGFMFGPIIGGLSLKHLGNTGPGWAAAGLCTLNFVLALFILVESRKPTSEHVPARPRLAQWQHTLSQPKIGPLVGIFFLATFCFSCFETTLPLLVSDRFHLSLQSDERSASTIMYLFAYCAVIGAFIQGGAIRPLVKRWGEPRLIALSLVLTGTSLALMPFISGTAQLSWKVLVDSAGLPWLGLLAVLALLSVGTALTRPPLFGLLSNLTPAHEQGATLGVAQSAGSLARIFGPIYAATLFTQHHALPYVTCAGMAVATGCLVAQRFGRPAVPAAVPEAQRAG